MFVLFLSTIVSLYKWYYLNGYINATTIARLKLQLNGEYVVKNSFSEYLFKMKKKTGG